MKTIIKNTYSVIFYFYIANFILRTKPSHFVANAISSNITRQNLTIDSKNSLEFQNQVLMDFEKRRFNLLRSFSKSDLHANLVVLQTNDIKSVKHFAKKEGLTLVKKIFKDEGYYLFRYKKCIKRCRRSTESFLQKLKESPLVQWMQQQTVLKRLPRSFNEDFVRRKIYNKLPSESSFIRSLFFKKEQERKNPLSLDFNDPLFTRQWYLHNTGQTGAAPENDINVLPVWKSGITGRGILISVLDDGVYGGSTEIADNYDSESSEDYLFMNEILSPIPENSHGTYCAAVAAGVANNHMCGVGVAYEAKVGGVRILDGGSLTDAQEAIALVHALERVDIYTASWGPTDDGTDIDGPGPLARMAFVKGVTQGRNGKGVIYVWAAGNGAHHYDNCNLDGYASSPFTLTMGALTENGLSTFYSEPCAAVIASTYIGGCAHTVPTWKIIQQEKRKIKVVVPEGRGKCRETFEGTSAAAPMAAGVIALALQANPELSWRDIQHIIVTTSRIPNIKEKGWNLNAAGKHFHPNIGFGVLDADRIVKAALSWKPVKPLHIWTSEPYSKRRFIFPYESTTISFLLQKSMMMPIHRVNRLEFVIATISIVHPRCKDLEIFLVSPLGTRSYILNPRRHDNRTTQFRFWDFVSLHFWGEDPEGLWLLVVSDHGHEAKGILDYFSLTLLGTAEET